MARDESEREDLVKEATAYTIRGEFSVVGREEPVFIGFRKNEYFSIYFGSEPVYQFDNQGRLRRAFLQGKLYRSEGNTLSEMKRERTETETALLRNDLSPQHVELLQWGMHEAIRELSHQISTGQFKILGLVGEKEIWLEKIIQGCDLILKSKEFLAPQLVNRKL